MCLVSSFSSLMSYTPNDVKYYVDALPWVTWLQVQRTSGQVTLWKTSPDEKVILAVETKSSSVSEKLLFTHLLSQRNK